MPKPVEAYVLLVLFGIIMFLLIGCSMSNTPTSKVEEVLMKYQRLDNDIKTAIDNVLDEQNFNDDHKERYRKLLEKQYKNMTYEIKEERIDGNTATIITEIEVLDYKNAISDLTFDSTIYTKESYDEEKLNRLENASSKVTYTMELTLTKDEDDVWHLNALTNEQIKKIQGMF